MIPKEKRQLDGGSRNQCWWSVNFSHCVINWNHVFVCMPTCTYRGVHHLRWTGRNNVLDISHPAHQHSTPSPGRWGVSMLSAWGYTFRQNNPQFSPLVPYWQQCSVLKPFCTNNPTSFQHTSPSPPSITQLYEMVGKRQALWNSFIYVIFSLDTITHVNCCYH